MAKSPSSKLSSSSPSPSPSRLSSLSEQQQTDNQSNNNNNNAETKKQRLLKGKANNYTNTKNKEQQNKQQVPQQVPQTCPSFHNSHLPAVDDLTRLRTLTAPHVESYNYFLNIGLKCGIKDLEPIEMILVNPQVLREQEQQDTNTALKKDYKSIKFWIENVNIAKPKRKFGSNTNNNKPLLPIECRDANLMYSGAITGTFCYQIIQRRNGIAYPNDIIKLNHISFGDIPIMILSSNCHLYQSTPITLSKYKEEHNEMGGYFIVNGIERCIRMLQIPKRNYVTAIQRSSYKKRGPIYTDIGVSIRAVRYNGDESAVTNTLHYLTTGGITLKFVGRKQEFLIPIILIVRSLSSNYINNNNTSSSSSGITDEELYRRIVRGNDHNTFIVARAGLLLQDARARYANIYTPNDCLSYIGSRFRYFSNKPITTSNIDIGLYIIRKYILIHLQYNNDKLECIIFMIRKLYGYAAGECGIDNPDSLQNHELLLPGHFMCSFMKEKFEEVLDKIRINLSINMNKNYKNTILKINSNETKYWNTLIDRSSDNVSGGIGKKVSYFLSTGNLISSTGLDMMQISGYTIVAEKLNFLRYISHFRAVHRGQFFLEMKTTAVRKLLPDSYGYLCPVHTPDGGPCGLLSHLALRCQVLSYPDIKNREYIESLLLEWGVIPSGTGGHVGDGRIDSPFYYIPVCLDGKIIGAASVVCCKIISSQLRQCKVSIPPTVPTSLEIAFIPPGNISSPYPGLYLFTGAARMSRPVIQRNTGTIEYISTLEQGFMDIAVLDNDIQDGVTTHIELDPINMLSLVANLTPFSDQNQSPRNMYQCQMAKQTMGTPCHSFVYRTDNKLYRLLTPQSPISQTTIHNKYNIDEYPNGTNAVVAVLSYTGYDMEDAMILNKSSYERGFAAATIYKTITVDLDDETKRFGSKVTMGNKVRKDGKPVHQNLELDGFPKIGERVTYGDPIYCTIDETGQVDRATRHKDREVAYIQSVRAIGPTTNDTNKTGASKVKLTLRYPRNPTIGDKFASRHGQKGVLSVLWPQEDMPFSESGITPDIIINPHAFPSRMTIGMLVESMAGKSGALHGHYQDATPFTFHESGDEVSLDHFGKELQTAGYNYYGSEALYSGSSGCVMKADLYIGIVYYQRLRHMVSDKYQVRALGAVNPLTRQPIKGRKKGGGIRLGEMERDSLLSHGTAFLLQDRLLNCSDRHIAFVCSRCGDILMTSTQRSIIQTTGQNTMDAINKPRLRYYCRSPQCLKINSEFSNNNDGDDPAIEPIVLPYVYRYLINELAGMNIKMIMQLR